jgi:hypothetical protein
MCQNIIFPKFCVLPIEQLIRRNPAKAFINLWSIANTSAERSMNITAYEETAETIQKIYTRAKYAILE